MAKRNSTINFALRDDRALEKQAERTTHIYGCNARCSTDGIGYASPDDRSPLDLVVHAADGFIPLWDAGVTLNWRFQQRSLDQFADPQAVAAFVRELLGEALTAWGPAVPVRFSERHQPWDFEIVLNTADDCDFAGRCTLAQAFFPDAGQHELRLFPMLFRQSRKEQIETMAHELGHVFGLRHFFAQTQETAFPSEIFGTHNRFSIMNYGPDSTLTSTDVSDLIQLYRQAWSGSLTQINGTPIRLVRPFSDLAVPAPSPALVAQTTECTPVS